MRVLGRSMILLIALAAAANRARRMIILLHRSMMLAMIVTIIRDLQDSGDMDSAAAGPSGELSPNLAARSTCATRGCAGWSVRGRREETQSTESQ